MLQDDDPGSIRVAVIQLDTVPATLTWNGRHWMPLEPLAKNTNTDIAELSTVRIFTEASPAPTDVLNRIEAIAQDASTKKVGEALRIAQEEEVDIVVLPEMVCDTTTLPTIVGHSSNMAIVVGLGTLATKRGAGLVSQVCADYSSEELLGRNVAVLVYKGDVHVVCKKHGAVGEPIVRGEGPRPFTLNIRGRDVRIVVAICLDFLSEQQAIRDKSPDIVCVPALTPTTEPFIGDAPRDWITLLSNGADPGGSTIAMAGLHGPMYTTNRCVKPLPAGNEGIIAADYFATPTRPSGLEPKQNILTLRAQFVERGSLEAASTQALQTLSHYRFSKQESRGLLDDLGRWMDHTEGYQVLADSLRELRVMLVREVEDMQLRSLLCGHFTVTPNLRANSVRMRQCDQVVKRIGEFTALGTEIERLGARLDAYKEAAGPRTPARSPLDASRWTFSIRLGRYDRDTASRSLPRQLNLLKSIGDLPIGAIDVTYRIQSTPSEVRDDAVALFDIIVTGDPDMLDKDEVEAQFRSIFVSSWSLSTSDQCVPPPDVKHYVRMELARGAKLSGLREDWSSVIDLLRAVGGRVSVDLQVTRVQQTSEVARTPRAESDELNQFMGTMSAIPYVSTLSDQSERFATAFHALRNQDDLEKRNIDLSIIVSSERPMPALLLRTVGHEIFGSAEFEINHVSEFQHGASDSPFSASEVLRIFHPPYGKIQGRGLPERESPTLYYLGRRKPGSGVKVGTAAISGPRADHNFDFMLEDEARLRHTYVVGRTGTGKTNLLKHMARQDIEAGRGVCVIDPHGDLVDYLSEHLSDRMSETLLLDFGDTDWLYAFNPFRVDFDDSRQRSLHVSDLISVLQTQFYNQYSGPRFNDMVRMGIDTMLQPAFPIEPAIALIEDLYQDNRMTNALMQRFAGSKIGRRWDAMADMRSSDRAELVSWALSKFADLMPEGGLMRLQLCSPWGEYSVSRLISERGILLVRVPDSKLGSQASGFLASLILKRIQRAVFSQPISAAAGEPLTLYIDEFQRVATAGLEPFIAEARKFNCGLVLAHQNLEQLAAFSTFEGARSRELIEVLIGNVGTAISFSVGPRDLDPVSELLGCRPSQLRDLGGFGAMVRTVIDGEQSPPFTISIPDSRSDTGLPASRIALRERMIELDVCRPIAEAIGSVGTLSARLEAALLGQPDRPVEAAKSDADRALDATPEAEMALGADESSTDEGTVSVDSGAQAFADYVAVAEREGLIDTGDEGYEAVLQRTAMLTQFHLGGSHAVSLKIADDVLALLGDSFETDSDADFAMNRILDKYGVVSERGRRNWKSFVSASRHLPDALSNGEVISVARLVSGWLARDVGIADELGFHLWYIRGMDSDAQFARMFSEDELLLLAGLMRIEVSVLKHGVMDKVADSLVDRMNTQNRPLIGADDSDGG